MEDDSPLAPYNGFLIHGAAMFGNPNSNRWRSLGIVFSANATNPTEVTRIQGTLFVSKREATEHGLELAKRWVDENEVS